MVAPDRTPPIVLAAGESRRFGAPKPLADWGGGPVLAHLLDVLARTGTDRPVVVLGHEAERVRRAVDLSGAAVVCNPEYRQGQTSSLQAGLRALPAAAAAFLMVPVDHPLLEPEALLPLFDALAPPARIVIPTHQGRRGHPPLLAREIAEEFLALAPDTPAHTVIRRDPSRVREIEIPSPGVVTSFNTPEELRACEQRRQAPRSQG